MQIRNRTHAIEWYHFQWPYMTLISDLKVTIIQRKITRKWYTMELYLQFQTNSKSYMNGAIFNNNNNNNTTTYKAP